MFWAQVIFGMGFDSCIGFELTVPCFENQLDFGCFYMFRVWVRFGLSSTLTAQVQVGFTCLEFGSVLECVLTFSDQVWFDITCFELGSGLCWLYMFWVEVGFWWLHVLGSVWFRIASDTFSFGSGWFCLFPIHVSLRVDFTCLEFGSVLEWVLTLSGQFWIGFWLFCVRLGLALHVSGLGRFWIGFDYFGVGMGSVLDWILTLCLVWVSFGLGFDLQLRFGLNMFQVWASFGLVLTVGLGSG